MSQFTYDHIHLRSPDPEATARWYESMLGATVKRSTQSDGKPRVDLDLGGMTVFIAPLNPKDDTGAPPTAPYAGLEHIGLRVQGIDAAIEALRAKGVAVTLEPMTIRPGVRIAFVRGPENVSIEILERTGAG